MPRNLRLNLIFHLYCLQESCCMAFTCPRRSHWQAYERLKNVQNRVEWLRWFVRCLLSLLYLSIKLIYVPGGIDEYCFLVTSKVWCKNWIPHWTFNRLRIWVKSIKYFIFDVLKRQGGVQFLGWIERRINTEYSVYQSSKAHSCLAIKLYSLQLSAASF